MGSNVMSTETIPQPPLPPTDPFGPSQPSAARKRTWLRIVVYVVLIAGIGLIVWRIHKNQQLSAQNSVNQAAMLANQPIPVQVAAAEQKPMPIYLTALGTVTPYMSVTVKARVSGELEPVKFTEGQQVRQGQTIMVIDPSPTRPRWTRPRATCCTMRPCSKTPRRSTPATRLSSRPASLPRKRWMPTRPHRASIRAPSPPTRPPSRPPSLQLDWCSIQSPIDGRIGLRLVDPGNIITANTTNLVIINQFQPIAVYFTLPENELPQVLHKLAAGQAPRR
jgi:multidrug efflux system membrane fusion protein